MSLLLDAGAFVAVERGDRDVVAPPACTSTFCRRGDAVAGTGRRAATPLASCRRKRSIWPLSSTRWPERLSLAGTRDPLGPQLQPKRPLPQPHGWPAAGARPAGCSEGEARTSWDILAGGRGRQVAVLGPELFEARVPQRGSRLHHPGMVEGQGHRTGGRGCRRGTFIRNSGNSFPRN